MKQIRLIAIDIDGTLVNHSGVMTEKVKETLQKADAQGIQVVLCTGRPLAGVKQFLDILDIVDSQHYVITYNGSLVQTTDGSKTIKEFGLSLADFRTIQSLADHLAVPYHAADREALYTTNKNIGKYTVYESNLAKMPIRYRSLEEIEEAGLKIQKMMMVDEPELLDEAIGKLPADFKETYYVVKSAPFYLEILNKEANKGSALQALVDYLKIPLDQVMAIGDNDNDLDMIKIAGHSVAMGNAVASIKEAARYHTDTNENDGVAKIVEQFLV